MTSNELQEIVNTVKQSLQGDAKTILQLPEATSVAETDCIEISGGKRCSFGTMKTSLFADWSGTQSEYNALTSYDAWRWYFIVNDDAVIALYRGGSLVWAVPNCVGQFSDDSTPDDWYWWPNGVKTALPVDPVTKRFSFYYPEVLETTSNIFSGGSAANSFPNYALIRVERWPVARFLSTVFYNLKNCDCYPVIDGSALRIQYGQYYTMNYILMNSSKRPHDVYFRNTEHVTEFNMSINNDFSRNPDFYPTRVFGLDLSRANAITNTPFGGSTVLIQAVNLGKRQELATADLRSSYWGDDSVCAGARQSVIDTLLTNSFDRASAGYETATIRLTEYTAGVLTDEEKAAITAKGYTITTE